MLYLDGNIENESHKRLKTCDRCKIKIVISGYQNMDGAAAN